MRSTFAVLNNTKKNHHEHNNNNQPQIRNCFKCKMQQPQLQLQQLQLRFCMHLRWLQIRSLLLNMPVNLPGLRAYCFNVHLNQVNIFYC